MSKDEVVFNFRRKAAAAFLPPLSISDNKARRGRSLLLAGSARYPGAGVLAARAALRMGSGYVTLAQPDIAISSLENPDFLLCDLNEKNWETLQFDSILVGPGFGVNKFTASVIEKLKERKTERVILDADALTVCAEEKLFPLLPTWIVTPHSGELARCLGTTSELVQEHRVKSVHQAHELMNCIVLLKGHHSLVQGKDRTYRIMSGNSGLAKSGTGDVLAGMITALRARDLSPATSACLGAYLHGACADYWRALHRDPLSLMASDIIELLPSIIYQIRSSTQ